MLLIPSQNAFQNQNQWASKQGIKLIPKLPKTTNFLVLTFFLKKRMPKMATFWKSPFYGTLIHIHFVNQIDINIYYSLSCLVLYKETIRKGIMKMYMLEIFFLLLQWFGIELLLVKILSPMLHAEQRAMTQNAWLRAVNQIPTTSCWSVC